MLKPLLLAAGLVAILMSDMASAAFNFSGPPKIAMTHLNAKNDGGWQQAIEESRRDIAINLMNNIPIFESIPGDASKVEAAVERYLQPNYNIVMVSSSRYSDALKHKTEEHSNIAFIDISGTQHVANLVSVCDRSYDRQYLCGLAASARSKSGNIGFVTSHPLGVVNWITNAYALGGQIAKPKAVVHAMFTGAWDDPVKEHDAASALIDQGADAPDKNIDTASTVTVGQERRMFGPINDRVLQELLSKVKLRSSVNMWRRCFIPEIQNSIAGSCDPDPYSSSPSSAQGGTDIACCNAVMPKDAVDKIQSARNAIVHDRQVFMGPIADHDCRERLPAGQTIAGADLRRMGWYVKNVVAQN